MTLPEKGRRWTRDGFITLVGSIGFLHETFVEKGERPTLLLACVALMGAPLAIRGDEKRKEDR